MSFLGLLLFGFLTGLDGTDDHMRVAAFQFRLTFHCTVPDQIFREPQKKFFAQVRVCDFAPPELHDCFDPIALFEESDGVVLFEIVIVIVGIRAEFQLFYQDDVLLSLGLMLLLLVLVLPLPIIHRFGDGRLGGGCDQDEVKTHVLSLTDGGVGW